MSGIQEFSTLLYANDDLMSYLFAIWLVCMILVKIF